MKLPYPILIAVSLLGCATSPEGPTKTEVALKEERARRSEAEASEAETTRRLRELEAQLSLARAEAQALREDGGEGPPREVVRIGEGRATSPEVPKPEEDDWVYEPVPDNDGSRPVLRLYGSRESEAAPRPAVPEGLPDRLPVADVPELPVEAAPSEHLPRRRQRDARVDTYQAALAHVRDGRFTEALSELLAFAAAHPDHPYADNALYWRGEVFYALRRYGEALSAFSEVVSRFPAGNKVPEAILKMAMCHKRMGDLRAARALLETVRTKFPNTVAARVASREDPS